MKRSTISCPRKARSNVVRDDVAVKIICVGLNYTDHSRETGLELPTEPLLFGKFANALIGPGEAIVLPPEAAQVDSEAELADDYSLSVNQIADAIRFELRAA